jgi:hypothetical protein
MVWGLVADGGPEKILKFLDETGKNTPVLFVGASTHIDFGSIIRQIRRHNPNCEITFSDKHESILIMREEFVQDGVKFEQMNILETPDEEPFWDCVVAFGLFSPSVLRENESEIALENIIKITKDKGFITISTHERNALNFEKMLVNFNHLLTYEKWSGYASHVPGKHQFIRGWKQPNPATGHYYRGYEEYDRGLDAYKAYLEKEGDRRTNFYITKSNN